MGGAANALRRRWESASTGDPPFYEPSGSGHGGLKNASRRYPGAETIALSLRYVSQHPTSSCNAGPSEPGAMWRNTTVATSFHHGVDATERCKTKHAHNMGIC